MNTQVQKKHVPETEVEAVYGIGVRQLRLMRARGDGPPWRKVSGQIGKSGGRVLYSVDLLERWIASRPGGGEKEQTA